MKGLGIVCSPTTRSCIRFSAWLSLGLLFVSLLPCTIPSACAWPFWLPLPTSSSPELEMTVRTDFTDVAAGDVLDYTCILRNTGDRTLSNISVTDGTREIGFRDTLPPGDVFSIRAKTPPILSPSRFKLTASSDGRELASQEFSIGVVEKEERSTPYPALRATVESSRIGGGSEHRIRIANTGKTELRRVKIVDRRNSVLGIIPALAPGESHTLVIGSVDVTGLRVLALNEAGEHLAGDVRYTGSRPGSAIAAESSETTLRTMEYRPSSSLDLILETSTTRARAGENISYRCTVINSCSDVIYNVDLLCHEKRMTTQFILPKRSVCIEGNFTINSTTEIRANVSGSDRNGALVTNETSVLIWVVSPELNISASADPPKIISGGVTNITVKLENSGSDLLRDIVVEDSFGHIGEIKELKPGEVSHVSRKRQITSSIDDIVMASARDSTGKEIYAFSQIAVHVYRAGMNLSLDPSELFLYPGEETEVLCTVENTGEVSLRNVTLAGIRSARIGEIPPGTETRIAASISSDISKDVTITATGYGDGDQVVSDTAVLSMKVIRPNITLSVMPTRVVTPAGDEFNVSCLVSNSGTDLLHDVQISESEIGTVASLGDLAPGEFRTVTPSISVNKNRTLRFTAAGRDARGRIWSADASSEAVVVEAALNLKISVSPEAARFGDKVRISCTVENVGGVPLQEIFVTSRVIGPMGSIDFLAPKQRKTVTMTIPLTMDISDTVTAEGLTPSRGHVLDREPLSIRLLKGLEPRPSGKSQNSAPAASKAGVYVNDSSVKEIGANALNESESIASLAKTVTSNTTSSFTDGAAGNSSSGNAVASENVSRAVKERASDVLSSDGHRESIPTSKDQSALSILRDVIRYIQELITRKQIDVSRQNATGRDVSSESGNISLEAYDPSLNTTLGIESVRDIRVPVRILDVTAIPPEPVAGAPVRVVAHIRGDSDVDTVVLEYGVADQSIARADMVNMKRTSQIKMLLESGSKSDGYWSCLIPGQSAGTILGISVRAECGQSSAEDGPYMLQWVSQAPSRRPSPLPETKTKGDGMLYIESTTVSGRGEVSIRDTFMENSMSYEEDLKGSGSLDMESVRCMEKSNPTVNFTEIKDISFDGGVLKGFKRFDSPVFHGGMGASITERFNMSQLDKSERGMIRSINYRNNTVAFSTEQAFEGMWNTRTEYSKFSKKMKADQRLNGSFQIQKNIKFQD
ncbi:hypothetical protein Mthe_0401 [Methanothrix thermoacetophila PT]|uniref:Uncharacterized protein n=2 Tax=Methanothrix TaxID=2222 RepID=A0B670_METTP|nr:hypothetical protein Mthe_0401 [Methanothrix thermoacetophila PT]